MNDLITLLLHLGILSVFVVLFSIFGLSKIKYKNLVCFVFVFLAYFGALSLLPPILNKYVHYQLNWNWTGKCISIIFWVASASMLVGFNRKFKLSNIGFTLKQNKGSTLPSAILLVALVFSFHIGDTFTLDNLNLEAILFQATMPGLDEEPGFRGVLLFILAGAIVSKEVKLFSAPINIACILITFLFGLCHGLSYESNGLNISYQSILYTGIIGFSLLWVRQRTGSLLLPIIFHNIFNVTNQFFQ